MGEPFDDTPSSETTDRHATPMRGRLLVVALGVAVLASAGAILLVRRLHTGGAAEALRAAGERELAQGHFEAAVRALGSAQAQGADAEALAPLLAQAQRAAQDAQALSDARRALSEGRFDDARVALQAVEPGSPSFAEAQTVGAQITPARAAALFERGKEALARKELSQAHALERELTALEPSLGTQLRDAIAEAGVDGPSEAAASAPVALGLGPDPVVRRALATGLALFAHLDQLPAAEAEFARQGKSHPDGAIRATARAMALGTHACAQAVKALRDPVPSAAFTTAVRTCAEVDATSPTVDRLRAGLAAALVRDGDGAAQHGSYLDALKAYRAAEATAPGQGAAQSALDRLKRQVERIASAARRAPAAQARDDWKVVLQLAPPGDPLHVEAASALARAH